MQNSQLDRSPSEAEKHSLIGNALCLDFVNTLNGHGGTPLHEYLHGYRDLAIWCRKAGVLGDPETERLIRIADRHPDEARAVLHRAIAFRETLYRVFSAIANANTPRGSDLAALDAARSEALAHSHIERTTGGFSINWDNKSALERMLWPIAISAGDLLTSQTLTHVHECSGTRCDWLFLDTSRNHMRRWCSMSECGNRAKARRFLQRKRTLAA
ncbi:MAG: ABATE domain-containing protein [Chloroflexi bacterium]|nr:ABATE domain-containing protein [Chloroflexota bacterium]